MLIALLLVAAALAVLGGTTSLLPPVLARRLGVGVTLLGLALAVAASFTSPTQLSWLRLDALASWCAAAVLIASVPALALPTRWAGLLAAASLLTVLSTGAAVAVFLLLLAALASWWRDQFAYVAVAIACFYLAARVGLSGILPIGWGLAVLGIGLLAAILGGLSAATATRFADALPGLAATPAGLAMAGLGLAMAARGADLLPAAALGLEAALLWLWAGSVSVAGLTFAAASVRAAAGTDELAQLGGLWPAMPRTGLCALVAGISLAVVPPSAGSAAFALLLQALFAANRMGGVFVQFALACAAGFAVLAAGLGTLATLRLLGLAFLGQPRASAAQGHAHDPGLCLAGLAIVAVLLGIAPGGVLWLAQPVLTEAALPPAAPLFLPSVVALLLALACAVVWAVMRQTPQARRVPAWSGGLPDFANPAPYLPGLVAAMRWRPAPRWPTLRECLAGAAATLAVVLIALAAR